MKITLEEDEEKLESMDSVELAVQMALRDRYFVYECIYGGDPVIFIEGRISRCEYPSKIKERPYENEEERYFPTELYDLERIMRYWDILDRVAHTQLYSPVDPMDDDTRCTMELTKTTCGVPVRVSVKHIRKICCIMLAWIAAFDRGWVDPTWGTNYF